MVLDPIIYLENAPNAEIYEERLGGIIKHYGIRFATSVMNRYVKNRLMASGHQINPQEVTNYVEKIAEGLSDAHRK